MDVFFIIIIIIAIIIIRLLVSFPFYYFTRLVVISITEFPLLTCFHRKLLNKSRGTKEVLLEIGSYGKYDKYVLIITTILLVFLRYLFNWMYVINSRFAVSEPRHFYYALYIQANDKKSI